MEISKNARVVLEKRYLCRDANGKPTEDVEGLFVRVSQAIAGAEREYDPQADTKKLAGTFYDMMVNLEFLPNSPTLMNAGRPLGQLSACFVLPVEDTMEDIFEAIKQAALIHKSGGGTGFSFSRLRAKGSTVNSTGGVASGPVSFMKVFNVATEAVKQGGTRRGANMGILRVDHPDILSFISCKQDTKEINNFNISVGLTENFIKAVENGQEYDLINPRDKKPVGKLSAREVFNTIVEAAWKTGEPGIVFLDRLNRDNVVPSQGEIEATNPCGEQPLLPYESCNLGSVNLTAMLKKDGEKMAIDWDKLEKTVENSVHFLDNVIGANRYPLKIIEETTLKTRKIGLGVMGWADMLLYLGIPYDSEEAVKLAEKVMGFIDDKAKVYSANLAALRGAFPLFGESIYKGKAPMRNATVTTIAPTGTLSIIAGVSSGIEPVFGYAFVRNVMDGTELLEVNPVLRETLISRGLYSDELMRSIIENGSPRHEESLPEDIRRVFVSAHDVTPEWHVRMQAAFQKHIDNAVSKTVNFPKDASCGDVASVYMLAYRLGCKGVTVYRDGSREEQVLNLGVKRAESKTEVQTAPEGIPSLRPRDRPEITTGFTERIRIGCGNLYITINYDEQGICEVFTNTGKRGGCPSQSEATARLATAALRSGVDPSYIVEQLRGIRCPSTVSKQDMRALSCPDAIARVLSKVLNLQSHDTNGNGHSAKDLSDSDDSITPDQLRGGATCPECGKPMHFSDGCVTCRFCGYSRCG